MALPLEIRLDNREIILKKSIQNKQIITKTQKSINSTKKNMLVYEFYKNVTKKQESRQTRWHMASKRGQNEGTIRQRFDGIWEARYTVAKDKEGRQKQKSIYGKTRQEVSRKMTQAISLINTGEFYQESNVMLCTWMYEWLETYKKPILRPSTYATNYTAIRKHIELHDIGTLKLSNLKPYHLQKLYNSLSENLAPGTIKRLHVIVKDALKKAVECDMLHKNPAETVKPPKQKKTEIKILTKEEQAKLIKALDGLTEAPAILLAMQTGLRLGELLGLKWLDVDLKGRVLSVKHTIKRVQTVFDDKSKIKKSELIIQEPKTEKSRRTVPLMESAVTMLTQHKKEQMIIELKNKIVYKNEDWIFCTADGGPLEPRNFTRKFHKILKSAGIGRINFHALRHTFVTRLLESGENIKTIAEIIGHSNVSLTYNIYAHVLPESKQSAVNKIDGLFR